MKNIKTFETFIIPKPIRKFVPSWNDEDIALQVLKELEAMVGNPKEITKLGIENIRTGYRFNLDGFDFTVKYHFNLTYYWGNLQMNDNLLSVSKEICKKIYEIVEKLTRTAEDDIAEYDKKDFRIRMRNKK